MGCGMWNVECAIQAFKSCMEYTKPLPSFIIPAYTVPTCAPAKPVSFGQYTSGLALALQCCWAIVSGSVLSTRSHLNLFCEPPCALRDTPSGLLPFQKLALGRRDSMPRCSSSLLETCCGGETCTTHSLSACQALCWATKSRQVGISHNSKRAFCCGGRHLFSPAGDIAVAASWPRPKETDEKQKPPRLASNTQIQDLLGAPPRSNILRPCAASILSSSHPDVRRQTAPRALALPGLACALWSGTGVSAVRTSWPRRRQVYLDNLAPGFFLAVPSCHSAACAANWQASVAFTPVVQLFARRPLSVCLCRRAKYLSFGIRTDLKQAEDVWMLVRAFRVTHAHYTWPESERNICTRWLLAPLWPICPWRGRQHHAGLPKRLGALREGS